MNPIFSITVKDIQNLSDEQSRELVARLCRAELRKNGISPAAVSWVEEHPCIANWIRHVVGKPILGWQPYAPWAYKESDTESRYLIDERVKVFVPNAEKGSDVLSAINRLLRELSKNVSVRIVGLSGVGKTRLVQALFDKRIITEQQTLDAVYVTDEDGEYITARRLVSLSMGEQQKTAVSEVPDDILIKWCDISPEDSYIFAADTCQLFEKSYSDQSPTNTTLALSAVAKSIFAGAKDKKAVLEVFSNRFHPRSYYDGSLSAILKKRLELLATLNPTDDEALRIQIAPAEEALKTIIASIEAREEADERAKTGSFE